jgi:filamentous hemagglutinin
MRAAAVSGSGNLFRSVGTTEDGSEPVYEELGPSGETTGKYVTLDSGGNPMNVGGNSGVAFFRPPSTATSPAVVQASAVVDPRKFSDYIFKPEADHGKENHRRLLEPIGNIPPAEAEERYYAMLDEPAMAA